VNFLALLSGNRLPEVLVGAWLVMGLLLLFGLAAGRALARAEAPQLPDTGITVRSVSEIIVSGLDTFTASLLGAHGARALVPFFGSLFLFILIANLLGLVPGFEPPTSDSDLTFALAVISFVFYIYQGFKRRGVAYLRTFLGPLLVLAPLMLPLEIADNLFRPFSLGVRLAANMTADHKLLGVFTEMTKLVVPLAFYVLGAIVCVVQALVFVTLSISYVKMAAQEH
jgi:F-type H+-transporting ATPase subunit a